MESLPYLFPKLKDILNSQEKKRALLVDKKKVTFRDALRHSNSLENFDVDMNPL